MITWAEVENKKSHPSQDGFKHETGIEITDLRADQVIFY